MDFEVKDVIGLAGVPVIAALVQVAKLWVDDARLYPLLAIAFGVLINAGVALGRGGDPLAATLTGVVAGLAASGLYSQLKNGASGAT